MVRSARGRCWTKSRRCSHRRPRTTGYPTGTLPRVVRVLDASGQSEEVALNFPEAAESLEEMLADVGKMLANGHFRRALRPPESVSQTWWAGWDSNPRPSD